MKKFFLLALSLLYATLMNAQLSGTYTINSNASQNPDYTSFSAATTALARGVSGPVTFQVAPGTYEEYVTLQNIAGASETNRVTFKGMGGSNLDVTVTTNAGYTNNSTLTLNGTDYVTFENMTLASTSEDKAVVVKMQNGNTGDHFQNVRFVGAVSNVSLNNDKNLVYRISGEWLDADNEFTNCEFVNGYIGLYYQGHNIYQYNDGVLVENCTFTNQASKSIYITFTDHVTVRGNTVNNTHDVLTNYHAIDLFRIRYNCIIENNIMNVTRNTNYVTVFELRPAIGSEEEPIIVRNNIFNLNCNVNSSYCCDLDDTNSNYIYFVNNTVKCYGNSNCGNMIIEKSWPNLFIYNNLFVNETSGYVFRFNANVDNRFSDYNRIAFSGNNLARVSTTDYATLSDWTAATGLDAHSALCTPQFVGTNNLHIASSDGLTVAHPLDYVPTDIDGDIRSNTPCTGADEYTTGTNLPPVVANPVSNIVFETYPASQTIDLTNTFNDPDDPNEDIVISVAANSNPTLVGTTLNNRSLQVQRLLSTGGNAVITLNAESNGQSVQTSFTVECVTEDLPPVVANPLAPINFTDYPQTLTFDLSNTFDDPDNNNDFINITVQSCPTEITAHIDDDNMLSVSRNGANAFSNKVLVIRATSNGKYVDMSVSVSGVDVVVVTNVADFEDVVLNAEGFWQGEEGDNEIFSGGWLFTNYYSEYFWGGFTASNHTDMTQTGLNAQYTSAAGGGHEGTSQYAVAYTMGAQTEVSPADGTTQTVTGCYVTNNLWAYQNMLEGDYTATPFGGTTGNDPDWFKLTATGKNSNGQTTGTVDFYLADYRFANNEEDYILNTWEWFDLSPLGEVASISFSLSSSKNDSYGMITPAYFCMDDFNENNPNPEDLPPYIANPVANVVFNDFPETIDINLDGVATDPDDPDENIIYSIVSNSNSNALTATLSNKTLTLTRLNSSASSANIVMRATSDGQSVNFTIHVTINSINDLPPYIVNPVDDVVFNDFPETININLDGVATDDDNPDENIVYSLVANSNIFAIAAEINGKTLSITRLNEEATTADLTLRATSNGLYVDFSIHVIVNHFEGVEEHPLITTVYPNPTEGLLTLRIDKAKYFEYQVFDLTGQLIIIGKAQNGETTIDLSRYNKGVYFISLIWDEEQLIQKVVLR